MEGSLAGQTNVCLRAQELPIQEPLHAPNRCGVFLCVLYSAFPERLPARNPSKKAIWHLLQALPMIVSITQLL